MFITVFLRTLKSLVNHSHPQILRGTISKINNGNVSTVRKIRNPDKNGSMELSQNLRSFSKDGILEKTVLADSYAYSSLLKDCISMKSLEDGKRVHSHIIKTGFEHNVVAQNNLVNMYAKCGSLADARQVFDKMPVQNAISWASVIAAYVQKGNCEEALKLVPSLQLSGIRPNEFLFSSALKACSSTAALQEGKQLHAYIMKVGCQSSPFVGNTLVSLYAKCGGIDNARIVFDNMVNRNVASWNSMIAGYARCGLDGEALELFNRMQKEDLDWDSATFATAVGVCANLCSTKLRGRDGRTAFWDGESSFGKAEHLFDMSGCISETAPKLQHNSPWHIGANLIAFELGKQLHSHIVKAQFDSNVFVGTALVDMYAKCGRVEDAWTVFNQMPERNAVSWTAMIGGYAQHGNSEKTLKLFNEMLLAGMKTDEYTYATVLSACATHAPIENGNQLHAHIIKSGFLYHMLVGNALVDMYAKSGSIMKGRKVFDEMAWRDVVSWNSMIAGYAYHGYGKEAIQLFEQMKQGNMAPDHITFVAVLSACSYEGLLSEGCFYFNCMGKHGIAPHMEHYTCMIGLLGRAGQLDKAEEFISNMPFEPDFVAWRTLLGACRDHSHIELGERVANCILKIRPQDPGTYVLLSNLYAVSGKWDHVARMRKLMKDRRVKKEPGLSWIEVKNRVHVFSVGDKKHPQTEEIYAKLQELTEQMKKKGYSPNISSLLIDFEQE